MHRLVGQLVRTYIPVMRVVVFVLASALCVAEVAAQPRIDSITPSSGPISGGTTVTLTGTRFNGGTVTIDDTVITPISATDTQIVFATPKRNNGIATIAIHGMGPVAYISSSCTFLPAWRISRRDSLPP
jgi:hypothetical protein